MRRLADQKPSCGSLHFRVFTVYHHPEWTASPCSFPLFKEAGTGLELAACQAAVFTAHSTAFALSRTGFWLEAGRSNTRRCRPLRDVTGLIDPQDQRGSGQSMSPDVQQVDHQQRFYDIWCEEPRLSTQFADNWMGNTAWTLELL